MTASAGGPSRSGDASPLSHTAPPPALYTTRLPLLWSVARPAEPTVFDAQIGPPLRVSTRLPSPWRHKLYCPLGDVRHWPGYSDSPWRSKAPPAAGQLPQSLGQLLQSSPGSQLPLPHRGPLGAPVP